MTVLGALFLSVIRILFRSSVAMRGKKSNERVKWPRRNRHEGRSFGARVILAVYNY